MCECSEKWLLRGLGSGAGFIIDLETEVIGFSFSESFTLHTRYIAVALDAGRTQVDMEVGFTWSQLLESRLVADTHAAAPKPIECPMTASTLSASTLEHAILNEVRWGFESSFLPLVGQWLDCALGSIAHAPAGPASGEADYAATQLSSVPHSWSPSHEAAGCVEGIQNEQDEDWCATLGSSSNFELHVEVVTASNLHTPQYRVGDFTRRLVSGAKALRPNIYLQLQLGERTVRTDVAENARDNKSACFMSGRALFAYSGEIELCVRAYDQRGVQALFRGDPLLGEGTVRLEPECLPRWVDVPLSRKGLASSAGSVYLGYQFVRIAGGGAPGVVDLSLRAAH